MSLSSVKTRDYPKPISKFGVNYMKTIATVPYTLANEDKGKVLNVTAAGTITVLPLSVPIGSQIDVINSSGGTVEFVQGTGTTLQSKTNFRKLATSYTAATLIKTGDSTWVLVGELTL